MQISKYFNFISKSTSHNKSIFVGLIYFALNLNEENRTAELFPVPAYRALWSSVCIIYLIQGQLPSNMWRRTVIYARTLSLSLQSKSCAVILITTPYKPGCNFLRCVPAVVLPRQEASERVIGAALGEILHHTPFPFCMYLASLSRAAPCTAECICTESKKKQI